MKKYWLIELNYNSFRIIFKKISEVDQYNHFNVKRFNIQKYNKNGGFKNGTAKGEKIWT